MLCCRELSLGAENGLTSSWQALNVLRPLLPSGLFASVVCFTVISTRNFDLGLRLP